jgi:hypothetical protein
MFDIISFDSIPELLGIASDAREWIHNTTLAEIKIFVIVKIIFIFGLLYILIMNTDLLSI